MNQKANDILCKLEGAKDRLSIAEYTQQYVLTLVEVKAWMEELAKTLTVGDLEDEQYATAYKDIFCPQGGISDYDRVCNTIEEYDFEDLPF